MITADDQSRDLLSTLQYSSRIYKNLGSVTSATRSAWFESHRLCRLVARIANLSRQLTARENINPQRTKINDVTKAHDFQQSDSSLAIFISRESLTVCTKTLEAAIAAVPKKGKIELLVNGNAALAQSLAKLVQNDLFQRVRVWDIPLGDKGNAWNSYIHEVWRGECVVFFIDGYVRLFPDSLERLYQTLSSNPDAFGGSGVPSVGRTSNAVAREMIKNGGFHGNLCCLTYTAISELKQRNIKIVVGTYRVDSLMGSIICYGLDTTSKEWNQKRLVVDPLATWDLDVKRWWRWSDLQAKIRQFERQLRGKFENAAIKNLFITQNISPEMLPTNCYKLIEQWASVDQTEYRKFASRHPFATLAYKRHLQKKLSFEQAGVIKLLTHR